MKRAQYQAVTNVMMPQPTEAAVLAGAGTQKELACACRPRSRPCTAMTARTWMHHHDASGHIVDAT